MGDIYGLKTKFSALELEFHISKTVNDKLTR